MAVDGNSGVFKVTVKNSKLIKISSYLNLIKLSSGNGFFYYFVYFLLGIENDETFIFDWTAHIIQFITYSFVF